MENTMQKSNINLENRALAKITGVKEVIGFNEDEIRCETCLGILSIQGDGLHVEALNLQVGELCIKGRVKAMIYSEKSNAKGIFKSLFHD